MKFNKNIKLILSQKIFEELKECSRKAYSIEACGLIFGDIIQADCDGEMQIHYIGKKFNCIKSNIESTGAFYLDGADSVFKVFLNAIENYKLRLISIFHSHPVPAYPSGIDEKNMKHLDGVYKGALKNPFKNQIWTIMDQSSEKINTFIYFNKELMQVQLEIINE